MNEMSPDEEPPKKNHVPPGDTFGARSKHQKDGDAPSAIADVKESKLAPIALSSVGQGSVATLLGRVEKDPLEFAAGLVTGEFLPVMLKRGNSSGMALLRTLWSGTVVYLAAIGLTESLNPLSTWEFSYAELIKAALKNVTWFGGILLAAYASFYGRYAAHWEYLSNLYNQIKAAEVACPKDPPPERLDALAQWKAGFIEDADDLRLLGAPMFASVVNAWKGDEVRTAFIAMTHGKEPRWIAIQVRAEKTLEAAYPTAAP